MMSFGRTSERPVRRRGAVPAMVAAVLVLALGLVACGGGGKTSTSADGKEMKSIDIALPGSGVAFYGWYAADALGYFKDESLDVKVTATGGSGESAQLLGAGRADVAEAAADQLLTVMTKVPVYPFYNFWEKEFRKWVVPEDSSIQGVEDLKGTTVGVTQLAGGEVPLVKAVLAEEGISDDVKIVSVGNEPASVLSAFEKHRIDSYAGEAQTVVAMDAKGFKTRSILPTLLAKGPLVPTAVSEKYKDDRDLMVGIGRAVAKGSLFCLTSVKACVEAIKQKHPEFVPDEQNAIDTLTKGYFPNTAPAKVNGKYVFGTTNTLEGWKKILDIYSAGPDPLIKDPSSIDLEKLVVTDLVKQINDFDYDAVVRQAKDWKAT